MILRGGKAPSVPRFRGGRGGCNAKIVCSFIKAHIAMAGMTLRDHVEGSLVRGR